MNYTSIYKYPLRMVPVQILDCPGPSSILAVKLQPVTGRICAWAMVQPKSEIITPHIVHMMQTGERVPAANTLYLDTVILGEYVYHFLEELPAPGVYQQPDLKAIPHTQPHTQNSAEPGGPYQRLVGVGEW